VRAFIVVLVLVVTWSNATHATEPFIFETGNELHEKCNTSNSTRMGDACVGYIIGVSDAISVNKNQLFGFVTCRPADFTVGQLVDVVKLWLKRHPAQRHYSAANIVAAALAEAFPCK